MTARAARRPLALTFSLLAATLTALVARFSRTLPAQASRASSASTCCSASSRPGTQLIAFAGALDLFFAGWELVGISSALFIGFFHERDEPVRSSVRAFATYRLCDAGLLIAIVTTHELLGSTRLSALTGAAHALRRSRPRRSRCSSCCRRWASRRSCRSPAGCRARWKGRRRRARCSTARVSVHAGLYLCCACGP